MTHSQTFPPDRRADRSPHGLAERFAVLRSTAQAERARAPAVDAVLLTLLVLLLARLERIARAWHPEPEAGPDTARPWEVKFHTHCGMDHPLLYVLGPGPNRGMRPHARRTPLPRPRAIAYWKTALSPHAGHPARTRQPAGEIRPVRPPARRSSIQA